MGISPRTVAFLRDMGHDAVHLYEQGLGRLGGQSILRKARDEGRVRLTHDLDFIELMAASGQTFQVLLFSASEICVRKE